ncbi:MAG: nucleoside deaminase [Angelakisella sp.]
MTEQEQYMTLALEQARLAQSRGEVPVGAVLVQNGQVLAACGNTREQENDPLGHAEIKVIQEGARILGDWRLTGCTLYVTLEPCPMCAGAILNARIQKVVYGASDPAAGCLGSRIHMFDMDLGYRPLVTAGILAEQCSALMSEFFKERR